MYLINNASELLGDAHWCFVALPERQGLFGSFITCVLHLSLSGESLLLFLRLLKALES